MLRLMIYSLRRITPAHFSVAKFIFFSLIFLEWFFFELQNHWEIYEAFLAKIRIQAIPFLPILYEV